MNVGRRMDYAVRAMCYLAAQPLGRVVPRDEIERRQRVPRFFLSKILRKLVAAGFLSSSPGVGGGFRLRRPAERISVKEVFECIEGPLSLMECIEHEEAYCCFAPVCVQRTVWRGAQEALGSYLERVSIGDLADEHGLVRRLGELHGNSPGSRRQAQR